VAEDLLDLRGIDRTLAYEQLDERVRVVLEGIDDRETAMATIAALVHHAFGHLWTGFYRVVEPGRLLRVGAYQGTLGCLEIAFGRGVCGSAAASGNTIVVPDVHAFSGHIACDSRCAPRSSCRSTTEMARSSPCSTSTRTSYLRSTNAIASGSRKSSAGSRAGVSSAQLGDERARGFA